MLQEETHDMKWQIDPSHTSTTVSARHLMLSTVRASLSGVTGELDFDPARPEAAKIRLAIPAATVNTGDEKRDGHLRSPDFLDAERFPEITFESRSVRKDGDGYTVSGDLTIRGTTRPADVSVTVNGVVDGMKGKVAGFSGTATIDRTKWGLVWNMPIPGGVLVSEKLKLEFDLQAVEAAARAETVAA
ncbi:MAG TPA: YceI family protein [Candidatus Limnocylindria bacterium]|nr:YceI family protein [Candidatus Limnocylindria bacterium]